ncbi:MAG: hypothetical protein J6Y20_15670 [Lachnospiraceae bacterium]|nr:hypothetical protein [Lachnospiraceae bacterium]
MIRTGALIALVLLLLLTGCGKETNNGGTDVPGNVTATTSASPTATATPSPTPTPERAPKEYSLAELYETAGEDNIFRLTEVAFSDAAQTERYAMCNEVQSAGDYVLMMMYDMDWENEHPLEYLLFHLGRPDIKRYFTPDFTPRSVTLLEDGTVVMLDWQSDKVRVYDREFEPVRTFEIEMSSGLDVLGISKDGLLWFCDSDEKCLKAYDINGNPVGSYPHSIDDVDEYIGTLHGKKYFRGVGEEYTLCTMVLEEGATELSTAESHAEYNGIFGCRYGERNWSLRILGNPESEVFFPKAAPHEYMSVWCGECFVTEAETTEKPSEGTEGDGATTPSVRRLYDYRVYDLSRQVVAGRLGNSRITQYDRLNPRCLNEKNYLFFEAETVDGGRELLLWDVSREEPEPIADIEKTTDENLQARIDREVEAIRQKYAIDIHYDEESLQNSPFVPWYEITPLEDRFAVLDFVECVAERLAEYPTELWREMCGEDKTGVDMYLDKYMVAPDDNNFVAAGVVDYSDNRMAVVFSKDALSSFGTTFAHETMHLMEYRIWAYTDANDMSWFDYWVTLNSEKYPYQLEYVSSDDAVPGVRYAGYARLENDPDDIWFVRSYGMWNQNEDRATVMERMYACDTDTFSECPHLRDKARAICAALRASFPCVAASEEPVIWERALGIIDPAEYYDVWRKFPPKRYG